MKTLRKKIKRNAGMTYVELIVVLSIFAIMTSITLFNYNQFEDHINIKNLSNDIALQIAQAQKSGSYGTLSSHLSLLPSWKPSYGLYFDTGSNSVANNALFDYFVDLNNNKIFDDSSCDPTDLTGECLNQISITGQNYISNLNVFFQSDPSTPVPESDLTLTFTRPNSGPIFSSDNSVLSGVYYIQIVVTSPSEATAAIDLYSSGRIQIE